MLVSLLEPLAAGLLEELLDELGLEELGLEDEPAVEPEPDDWSLLEELEELGLLGVAAELELELGLLGVAEELEDEPDGLLGEVESEPDAEPELDGLEGLVLLEPDGLLVLPEDEDAPERSALPGPRSQPPIRVAPSARETASAKAETFMGPP